MNREIEFTADEIRTVWSGLFGADVPDMPLKKIYEACLSELSPEILRDELRKVRNENHDC